jgi:glycerol-3-phosphate dehydrogenase
MKIAVIGGGINGVMTAWELIKNNHEVTLYEENTLMSKTSSASSKLLHGGLRYLENFEFSLVKEALRERYWWLNQSTNLVAPIKIFIPIYKNSKRSALLYKIGLVTYDLLAGKNNIGKHQSHSKNSIRSLCPELKFDGICKGYSYFDAQMDDHKLGIWAADKANESKKLKICENTLIKKISNYGDIYFKKNKKKFDKIINVCGPWTNKLLKDSGINPYNSLKLIRGSHIVIDRKLEHGYFLEVPGETRIFFVLPYKGQTLIGTTEEEQSLTTKIKVTDSEIEYLLTAYNNYFMKKISKINIVSTFSGIRPVIRDNKSISQSSRDYKIVNDKNLICVYGGKWTTSRQLAKKVVGFI